MCSTQRALLIRLTGLIKMEVSQSRHDRFEAIVHRIENLNSDTVAVRLGCADITHYQAGQYLQIFIDAQTTRYYSLASAPGIDVDLQLHVRRGSAGSASRWFHEVLAVGDTVHIGAPRGKCGYQPGQPDQPLLLVCTGSGLAPYYGIARAALQHGHRAPIHLYHGVRYSQNLYLVEQLRALARLHSNFHYVPCVSGEERIEGCHAGRALDVALRATPLSAAWRVYFSGHPDMVEDGWKGALQAGVPSQAIFSDQAPSSAILLSALAA